LENRLYSEGQNDENLPEAGIDDIQPNGEESIITLWEWESGIPLPTTTTTTNTMEESPHSPMNRTTIPEYQQQATTLTIKKMQLKFMAGILRKQQSRSFIFSGSFS
jgi:hypothetical protein